MYVDSPRSATPLRVNMKYPKPEATGSGAGELWKDHSQSACCERGSYKSFRHHPLPKSKPESSLISMKGYQKSFFSDERRNMRDGWIELKPPGLNGRAVRLGQPDGLTLSERLRSRAPSAPLS